MSEEKTNLTIVDLPAAEEFLSAICRFVTSAKFTVDADGCSVMANDENKTVRAYFKSRCITSTVPVSFAIGDVRKLQRCVSALADEMPKDKKAPAMEVAGLCYNTGTTTLEFTGKISFSIATVDERVIEKFVGRALKAEPPKCFGVTITEERHRKLVGLSSINTSTIPKVYLYKGDSGAVMAEINDKSSRVSDSISIELAPAEKSYGSWDKILTVKLDEFRNFMLLKDAELSIHGIAAVAGQPPSYVKTEMAKMYQSGVTTKIDLIFSLQKV